MRRTASEIIRNLEQRIARLERQAGASSELEIVLEKAVDIIKKPRHGSWDDFDNQYRVSYSREGEMPRQDGEVNTVISKSSNEVFVLLDEATTPNLCSRIKSKDRNLNAELNSFFNRNTSKIARAVLARGAVESLKNEIHSWMKETEDYLNEGSVLWLDDWIVGGVGGVSAGSQFDNSKCYIIVSAKAQQSAKVKYEEDEDHYNDDFAY